MTRIQAEFGQFAATAARIREVGIRLDHHTAAFRAVVDQLGDGWQGGAAEALDQFVDRWAVASDRLRATLDSAATELEHAEAAYRAADAEAAAALHTGNEPASAIRRALEPKPGQ